MIARPFARRTILSLTATLAVVTISSATAVADFNRGRHLVCQTNTNCATKNMPLLAQCGTTTDPIDLDVVFTCGVGCANTSHNTLISTALSNRSSTKAYGDSTRSILFFNLKQGNSWARNSWILRENAKNNLSYYPANGLPTPSTPPPAYSMQNAIYDFAPSSTTLWPAGCDIKKWWTCTTQNTYGKSSWWGSSMQNNDLLSFTDIVSLQNSSWVVMLSYSHQSTMIGYSDGQSEQILYLQNKPHKVAVSGYDYPEGYGTEQWIRINDVGSGIARKAFLKIKRPRTWTTLGKNGQPNVTHYEILPNNATAWPYVRYSDENEIKLLERIDFIDMN